MKRKLDSKIYAQGSFPKISLGGWISDHQLRSYYWEIQKGIFERDGRKPRRAIIVNFPPNRKRHHSYRDSVDLRHGMITYRGQGRTIGQDQSGTADGNRILLSAFKQDGVVDVFFDCGSIKFAPPKAARAAPKREKQLMFAGEWRVRAAPRRRVSAERRKVFLFRLKFSGEKAKLNTLQHMFLRKGIEPGFERALSRFAEQRRRFYDENAVVLRTRDSIVSEIGEYFAIKAMNRRKGVHLLRLPGSFRDVDAVDVNSGKSFAIKSASQFPRQSSNIWASKKELKDRVDFFLVCIFAGSDSLVPQFVAKIKTDIALRRGLFSQAKRQANVLQLSINHKLMECAEKVMGKWPHRG